MAYSLWQSSNPITEELALSRIPYRNFLAATVLWALANIATTKSLQLTQASVFNAILSLRTVWSVLLAAVFFDETTNLAFWAGTLMILLAAVSIAIDPQQKYSFDSTQVKGVAVSLATSILFATAVFNDASALRNDFNTGAYFVVVFTAPALLIFFVSSKAREETKLIVADDGFRWFWILGPLVAASAVLFIEAFKRADFSVVSSINQLQAIVVTLGAIFLLKEKDRLYLKIAAGCITFAGAVVIVALSKTT